MSASRISDGSPLPDRTGPAPPRNYRQAVGHCFSHYATFSGRASRSEFWWFSLFALVVSLGLGLVEMILLGSFGADVAPLSNLFSLVILIPGLAVGARRLHDIGRSGWWQLLGLLPIVGLIVLIVWWVRPGEPHPNRFG